MVKGTLNVKMTLSPSFNARYYGKIGRTTELKKELTFDYCDGVNFPKHGVKFSFESDSLNITRGCLEKAKVEVEVSRYFFEHIGEDTNYCYTLFCIDSKVVEVFFYINEKFEIDGGLQVSIWHSYADFESDEEADEIINVEEKEIKKIFS